MGDRALVIFHNKARDDFSPVIYLHWAGSDVPKFVAAARSLMADRLDDVSYSAARFCGICHAHDPNNNLSLGIWNLPKGAPKWGDAKWKSYSHGGAGVVLVDASDFSVRTFGGYLKPSDFDSRRLPARNELERESGRRKGE